ncbi:unnamed protein product, partial [marine sediment metagenome]
MVCQTFISLKNENSKMIEKCKKSPLGNIYSTLAV